MIILNMGIPRSGTVWVFNVIRHILSMKNISYMQETANHPDEVDSFLGNLKPDDNLLLHLHDITDLVRKLLQSRDNNVISFLNYRDPRDVVVSHMKLHDSDFSVSVQKTMAAFKMYQTIMRIQGIMVIPYSHIKDHAEALIFQISLRLGFVPSLGAIKIINEATSGKRLAQVMNKLHQPVPGLPEEDIRSEFTGHRAIRYHKSSLISDRHIQSGQTGRWKKELTQNQQEEINRIFADIINIFGFETEQA